MRARAVGRSGTGRAGRGHGGLSERLAKKASDQLADVENLPASHELDRKEATVRAAIERARARRIMFGKQ